MKYLLLLLLALTACTGTTTFTQYSGTDGLSVRFEQNAPPAKVYEGTQFPVKIAVKNSGAFDVSYDQMMITFSTDPLYVAGGISPYWPKVQDRPNTELLGKSITYPSGQEQLYGIPTAASFKANVIYGQREAPTTDLTVNVCYAYTTYASTQVCIDTNLYEQNQRTQVCKAQDITFSGGQGAPIAITMIEVHALPIIADNRESVRPEFVIHVQNVGGGYLVGPSTLSLESACLLKSIPKDELNAVVVSAQLHGTPLECGRSVFGTPKGVLKLEGGLGEISCTVPSDKLNDPLYSAAQNFETTLLVNITYLYKTSAATTLEIQRVPGAKEESPTDTPGKLMGYAYNGETLLRDEQDNPMTLCQYYGENPEKAPSVASSRINEAYSCGCGPQTCLQQNRASPGSCYAAFCPGDVYCCTEQGPKDGTAGVPMDISTVTMYYTAECGGVWSTTNARYSGSLENCRVSNKGFYEDVKCQGSGYCNGNVYSAKSIGITEALSRPTGTEPLTSSGTVPQAHRTIATNNKPGTPCYVPTGSRVQLDFGPGNPWNGEYVAEDVGSAINNCHIDVYVGRGKAALESARVPGTATLTILG